MFRYGHFGFHTGPGLFGWLFMALLGVLLVLLVVSLFRRGRGYGGPGPFVPGPPPPGPGIDPALQELRIRYARGDISWDEYAQRAANLGYPASPWPGPGGPGSGPGAGSPPTAPPTPGMPMPSASPASPSPTDPAEPATS